MSAWGGGGGSPRDGSIFSKISSGRVGRGESTLGNGDTDVSIKELQLMEFSMGIAAMGASPLTVRVLQDVTDAVDGIVGAKKELALDVIVGVATLDLDLRLPRSEVPVPEERCLFPEDGGFNKV